jgi:diaminopimelate epimerase
VEVADYPIRSSLVKLYRSHGLGNDYLVLEDGGALTPSIVRAVCDRNRGVGGDGILEPVVGSESDYGVRIWNPDGSIAEKSGNGLRIFAAWLVHFRGAPSAFSVWTGFDKVYCKISGSVVEIEMGTATLEPAAVPVISDVPVVEQRWRHVDLEFPVTVVSMGNPHCVAYTEQALDTLDWRAWGEELETDSRFPNRTNVQVARVLGQNEVEIRIWERGAGETLASGSSSCAVVVAGVVTGRLQPGWTVVRMPGGCLDVHVDPDLVVILRGPVEFIGRFELEEAWLKARLNED